MAGIMITVEMHFDFASPYSFFADARIDEVLAGTGACVKRIPVYLRGFDAFRSGVPFVPAKLAYIGNDLMRHSARYAIPFSVPASFPVNGLYALRAYAHLDGGPLADAFRRAAFSAIWQKGRDLSNAQAVLDVAAECGAPRDDVAAAMESPAIKDKIKANTAASIARGAFGVPTFFVGDEMLWGHDRLDFVRWEVEKRAR